MGALLIDDLLPSSSSSTRSIFHSPEQFPPVPPVLLNWWVGAAPRKPRLCLQSLRIPLLIGCRIHAGVMLAPAWHGSICNVALYVWHRLIINEPTWFDRYYPRRLVDEDVCHHSWGVSWEDHNAHVSGKGMEINLSIDDFRFIEHEQPLIERKPTSCDWLAHYFQLDSECWYPRDTMQKNHMKEMGRVLICLQASCWFLMPFQNSLFWLLGHSVPCFLFRSAVYKVKWLHFLLWTFTRPSEDMHAKANLSSFP